MDEPPDVTIVNYGLSNLGSVLNMFRRLGVSADVTTYPERVESARRILLPGVGAFDSGMNGLQSTGLGDAITKAARSGTPVLGVCLGMQLLTARSEEGSVDGLGLIDARCRRLAPDDLRLRVPHMGWNWVTAAREHDLLRPVPVPMKFYFAHSYSVSCASATDVLGSTRYGEEFASMIARDNVVGAQFHPEKSHKFGMALLSAFAGWRP